MKCHTLCLALMLSASVALAEAPKTFDWPQWQGPDRNSVSKETGLLKEWPKDGPPLAWKAKGLGGGYSGPSVAAGRVFGMGNRGQDEVVWALSETDGKEIWTTRIGPAYQQGAPQGKEGPASTPTVDDQLLYAVGLGGELACIQVADGKIVWHKNLTSDFGGTVPRWSYRESPLVDGEHVICTPGGKEATLVALDKKTGATVWKSPVPGGPLAAYSSAIAIDSAGQRQYVQFTQRGVVGVAAADGKFLWRYDQAANRMGINITTPLCQGDEIFATSAYGTGAGLVKLSKADGGVILLDGYLYGATGGNEGGRFCCLEFATGKLMWGDREVPKGSIVLADGRFYYRTEAGLVLLIEPSSKGYLERGRFTQPDRSRAPAWPHPVVAYGKLYLRDQDVLFSYEVKAK